jgi:predicted nucleic acid-binding Zn ribbon protein
VLGDLGLEAAANAFRIGERWGDVVGPEVARHCRPVAVRGEVLEVEVDSSVWCQELQMQSPQLLAALSEAFGDDAPSDLRFRVGYHRGPASGGATG